MFGYITPLQDELKVKELRYFKSYYCGLCHSLKNNFNDITRLTLNYDLTFISFIIDGLYSNELNFKNLRCIKHYNKKIPVASSTLALDYAANLNIILSNLKFKDNIEDDHSIKDKFCYIFLSPYDKIAQKKLNKLSDLIYHNIKDLSTLEKAKDFKSLDEICHPFSDSMGNMLKLFPYPIENDSMKLRNMLYDLGYSIGKWIYLMDALDDLNSDMTENKFNPYNILFNKESMKFDELIVKIIPDLEYIILSILSNCSDIIKEIPFKKHLPIINNIVNLGMMNQYYTVLFKIKTTIEPKKNSNSQ